MKWRKKQNKKSVHSVDLEEIVSEAFHLVSCVCAGIKFSTSAQHVIDVPQYRSVRCLGSIVPARIVHGKRQPFKGKSCSSTTKWCQLTHWIKYIKQHVHIHNRCVFTESKNDITDDDEVKSMLMRHCRRCYHIDSIDIGRNWIRKIVLCLILTERASRISYPVQLFLHPAVWIRSIMSCIFNLIEIEKTSKLRVTPKRRIFILECLDFGWRINNFLCW